MARPAWATYVPGDQPPDDTPPYDPVYFPEGDPETKPVDEVGSIIGGPIGAFIKLGSLLAGFGSGQKQVPEWLKRASQQKASSIPAGRRFYTAGIGGKYWSVGTMGMAPVPPPGPAPGASLPPFYPPVAVPPPGQPGTIRAPVGQRGGAIDMSKVPAAIRGAVGKIMQAVEKRFVQAWIISEVLDQIARYREAVRIEDREQAARIKAWLDGIVRQANQRKAEAEAEKRRQDSEDRADARVAKQIEAENRREAERIRREDERIRKEEQRAFEISLELPPLPSSAKRRPDVKLPPVSRQPTTAQKTLETLGKIINSPAFALGTRFLDRPRSEQLGIRQLAPSEPIPEFQDLTGFVPGELGFADLSAYAGGGESTSTQVCSCRPRYVKRRRKKAGERRICYTRKVK